VSGYIGTGSGRDINFPMTQGLQSLPQLKPKRFAVSYHLLALRRQPARVRLQTWLDEGQPVPSVIRVWPGADFYEREQFDMMGIQFDGHPYLKRLLMEEDWEGHPLRKDYPIGGEPVRFSEAE
jgi:NADH-quinone oxidoreductase subunit C